MSIEKEKKLKHICGNCKHIQLWKYFDTEEYSCQISMEKTEENAEACEDWEKAS